MISPAKLLELESRFRFYIKLVNTPTNLWSWITHLLSIPKRYVISPEIASSSVGRPQRFTCKSLSLPFFGKLTKKPQIPIIIYRKSSKNEHWWFKLSNWRKEKAVFDWFFYLVMSLSRCPIHTQIDQKNGEKSVYLVNQIVHVIVFLCTLNIVHVPLMNWCRYHLWARTTYSYLDCIWFQWILCAWYRKYFSIIFLFRQ